MPARLQLIARTGHPDFLDLPWEAPLEEWQHARLVEVVRGIHRHVVRFVEYEGPIGPRLYALKERLDLPGTSTRNDLDRAMQGKILAQTELLGIYSRK